MKEKLIAPEIPASLRSNPQARQAVVGLLKALPADKHQETIQSLMKATNNLDPEQAASAAQRTAGQIYQEHHLSKFREVSFPKGEGSHNSSAPTKHADNPYDASGNYIGYNWGENPTTGYDTWSNDDNVDP